MTTHKITGDKLLSMLAEFPSDALPDGVTDEPAGLYLDGRKICKNDVIELWPQNGNQPLHKFDSDWTVCLFD